MSGLRIKIEIDRVFLAGYCADPEGPEARPACGWLGVTLAAVLLVQMYLVPRLGDRRNHAGISIFTAPWDIGVSSHG